MIVRNRARTVRRREDVRPGIGDDAAVLAGFREWQRTVYHDDPILVFTL